MILARKLLASAAFAAVVLSAPANAQQIVTGGTTDVTLTAAPTLTGLGLTAAPTGTATVGTDMSGIPTFTFPITGGSIDASGDALFYHEGSGILFTAGGSSLGIGNFVIDTAALLVTGDVTANGTDVGSVGLFTIGPNTSLLLTADAAGAFTSIFGAPNLTGANVGFATVNAQTQAVPEPGTWMMMLAGFGAAGFALRRSRRRMVLATARA
jgi:hypothetical protein